MLMLMCAFIFRIGYNINTKTLEERLTGAHCSKLLYKLQFLILYLTILSSFFF